jgi:glycerophosphoryl diester phosphodiesterase
MEVHGHRGARARFPENTLPAFEYATKLGVDFLEMDIAITKDRHLVISHDPHISSIICLDPQRKIIKEEPLIFSLTLAQVKSYDCGTLKNPRFPDQHPVPGTKKPTLDEVFQLIQKMEAAKNPNAKRIKFNIETKIFADHPEYTVGPEEFVNLLLAKIKEFHMLSRVVIQSFDYRTLALVRKLEPRVPLSALTEDPKASMVEIAKATSAEIISPDFSLLTKEKVAELQTLRVRVLPWTLDTVEDWKNLIEMKVDGIITDDPEGLLDYLKRK